MSYVLANTSRLKPEIRLAQAVSQFETDLSSEQKNSFRAYRSESRDSRIYGQPRICSQARVTWAETVFQVPA